MEQSQPSRVRKDYVPNEPSITPHSLTTRPIPQLAVTHHYGVHPPPATLPSTQYSRPIYPGQYLSVPLTTSYRAPPQPSHTQQLRIHLQDQERRYGPNRNRQQTPKKKLNATQIIQRQHAQYLLNQQQGRMERFTPYQLRNEVTVLDRDTKLSDLTFGEAAAAIHAKYPALRMSFNLLPDQNVTIVIYDPHGTALHTQSGVVIKNDLDIMGLITLVQMYIDQWIVKVGWYESLVIEGIKIRFGPKEETDRYPSILGTPWKEEINGALAARLVTWDVESGDIEAYWKAFRAMMQHVGSSQGGGIPLFKVHTIRLCGPQLSDTRLYIKELGTGHLFSKNGRAMGAKDFYTEQGDNGAILGNMGARAIQDIDNHGNLWQFITDPIPEPNTGGTQAGGIAGQGGVSASGSEDYGYSHYGNSTATSVDFGSIPIANDTELTPTKTALQRKISGENIMVDTNARKGQRVTLGPSRPSTPVASGTVGGAAGQNERLTFPSLFEPDHYKDHMIAGGPGDPNYITTSPGKYHVIRAGGELIDVWVPDSKTVLVHPTENWSKWQKMGGDPAMHAAFPLGSAPYNPNEFNLRDLVGTGRYPVSDALATLPKMETEEERANRVRYEDKFVYITDEDEMIANGQNVQAIRASLPPGREYTEETKNYMEHLERALSFEDDNQFFPDPSVRDSIRSAMDVYKSGNYPHSTHGGHFHSVKPTFGPPLYSGGLQHPAVGAIKAQSTTNWGPGMNAGTPTFARPNSNLSSTTASPNASFGSTNTLADPAAIVAQELKGRKSSASSALNVNAPAFSSPGVIVAKPKHNAKRASSAKRSVSKPATAPVKPVVPVKTAPFGSPFSAKFGAPPTMDEFYAGLKNLHPSYAQLPAGADSAATGAAMAAEGWNGKVSAAPTTGLSGFKDFLSTSGLNTAPVANQLNIVNNKLPESLYKLETAGPGKPGMRAPGGYYDTKTSAAGMREIQSYLDRGDAGLKDLSDLCTKLKLSKDGKEGLSEIGKQLKDNIAPKQSRFFPTAASGGEIGQTNVMVPSLGDASLWPDTMYINKEGERTSLYGQVQGQGQRGVGYDQYQASADDLEATRRKFPSDTVDKAMKKGGGL